MKGKALVIAAAAAIALALLPGCRQEIKEERPDAYAVITDAGMNAGKGSTNSGMLTEQNTFELALAGGKFIDAVQAGFDVTSWIAPCPAGARATVTSRKEGTFYQTDTDVLVITLSGKPTQDMSGTPLITVPPSLTVSPKAADRLSTQGIAWNVWTEKKKFTNALLYGLSLSASSSGISYKLEWSSEEFYDEYSGMSGLSEGDFSTVKGEGVYVYVRPVTLTVRSGSDKAVYTGTAWFGNKSRSDGNLVLLKFDGVDNPLHSLGLYDGWLRECWDVSTLTSTEDKPKHTTTYENGDGSTLTYALPSIDELVPEASILSQYGTWTFDKYDDGY